MYEAAIAFNSSLAVTSTATSVFEVAASFATSLAETNAASLVYEAAAVFANELTLLPTETKRTRGATVDLYMFEGVTPTANADMTVALALAKSLATAFDTGSVFNEALTLALTQQLVPTVTAIFEAAASFANAQGISDGNTAVMEAVQNLGICRLTCPA